MARTPLGPSAKFLVQNIHTAAELKFTGNHLLFSRPFLVFDAAFDAEPHLQLLKEMFQQTFGTPRGHRKSKPFVDHTLAFYMLDGHIWVRNYQIAKTDATGVPCARECAADPMSGSYWARIHPSVQLTHVRYPCRRGTHAFACAAVPRLAH